jgi:hypothetical protein
VDGDPATALAILEKDPPTGEGQPRGLALHAVALYNLGRYGACADLLREARDQGTDLRRLAREAPRLGRVLARDRQEHHLGLDLGDLGPPRRQGE